MKRIAVVGSTGSIGASALEVVAQHSSLFQVELLVAGSNYRALAEQIKAFRPQVAGLVDESAFQQLLRELGIASTGEPVYNGTRLVCGESEVLASIRESHASLVLAAAVGMAGLPSVMCALESGKDVALANKEALVVAGSLVLEKANQRGVQIIPVDSEHSAIFQVLQNVKPDDLSSIILTASGGPFRRTPLAELGAITPAQALKHPQWSMGAKITIDSATMMNKALEVIEAHWLFNVPSERIEVIVHPQSIIHSMIRLRDNSVLAQASVPVMKGPIAYALNYPHGRLDSVMDRLDFAKLKELTFEELDNEKFPSVERARACLQGARGAAAVFNAANEVAVEAFLSEQIPFLAIHAIIADALDKFGSSGYSSLQEVQALCASVTEWARHRVSSIRK
jgi:1-deoxy-D-xylulose-5-phosphate reductoisomerase